MAPGAALCEESSGRIGAGVMSATEFELVSAFAVGVVLAGCWSLISGLVVMMALAAFGFPVG